MNERYQEVLEQYEVETLSVRKAGVPGSVETDKGLKLYGIQGDCTQTGI